MKIPKTVKIGAGKWTVIYDQIQHQENRRGATYKELREIHINSSLAPSLQEVTFVHELLHACAEFVGIQTEKLTEEEWIVRVSPILHTILIDNDFSL